MRKFLVCAGLAVAGTTSLHAAYAPDLNPMETAKLWTVSGTLRGFYDDNYNTAAPGPNKRSSFGFEVSPSVGLNVPLQQTELGLRYTYGLYYYQDRDHLGQNAIDQTHQLDLWVDHAFTERWSAKVQDSLAVGQEPQLLNGGGTLLRAQGDNFHNDGTIVVDTQWTRLLGTEISYENNLYDYQNSGGNFVTPSLAGLLNRLQHDIVLSVNWRLQPELLAFVGYQFEQVNYTGSESIGVSGPIIFNSNSRDSRSHIGYVGAQYTPLDNVTLAVNAGIQYADYYNPPAGAPSTSQISPYAKLSGTYTYLPGSYVQLGFTQSRNATDVVAPTASGKVTEDQETSLIYGSLNHQITARLAASLTGQIQYSTFNGGTFDGTSQTWYSMGLNLAYTINPHISTEIGYNFDDLTSKVPGQKYDRNRVYLGVTGTY
jgi:hypothetical protein